MNALCQCPRAAEINSGRGEVRREQRKDFRGQTTDAGGGGHSSLRKSHGSACTSSWMPLTESTHQLWEGWSETRAPFGLGTNERDEG